ncbi:hypothetical protein VV11_021230 [Trichodesmium erythraeum 21-75]|nr:hypothetical protein [Trichodesmium erythraeum 21-75]
MLKIFDFTLINVNVVKINQSDVDLSNTDSSSSLTYKVESEKALKRTKSSNDTTNIQSISANILTKVATTVLSEPIIKMIEIIFTAMYVSLHF